MGDISGAHLNLSISSICTMKTLTWIFINKWNTVQIPKHPVTMKNAGYR